jgi:hypothetical protein
MSNLNLQNEYVDNLKVHIEKKCFYLYGSDGSYETISCDTSEQFIGILEFAKSSIPSRITYGTN